VIEQLDSRLRENDGGAHGPVPASLHSFGGAKGDCVALNLD